MLKPPPTDAHRERDRYLQMFHAAGLVPIVSTNGGIPDADIQVTKTLLDEGGKHGDVLEARLTDRGQRRLAEAQGWKPVEAQTR